MSHSIRHLAAAAIAVATVCVASPASAGLGDPPTGEWQFRLYEDSFQRGGYGYVGGVRNGGGGDVMTLGSMNDKASSWSLCNDTGVTAYLYLWMYNNANLDGIALAVVGQTIPDGTCLASNHLSPNDSISSYRIWVYDEDLEW